MIITHKIKSVIIISKYTVKWYIIRTVQAKSVFLKIWVEFQIGRKLWVPCFRKTWVPRSIHIISVRPSVNNKFPGCRVIFCRKLRRMKTQHSTDKTSKHNGRTLFTRDHQVVSTFSFIIYHFSPLYFLTICANFP